jgi:hypothetical protein
VAAAEHQHLLAGRIVGKAAVVRNRFAGYVIVLVVGAAVIANSNPNVSPGRLEMRSTDYFLLNVPGILTKYKV